MPAESSHQIFADLNCPATRRCLESLWFLPPSAAMRSVSNSSDGSSRSLRSRGAINPNPQTAGKQRARGSRTTWTLDETSELVHLLHGHKPSAGDKFQDETFNQVAIEINAKYTSQKVPKTGRSCALKFSNVYTSLIDVIVRSETDCVHS